MTSPKFDFEKNLAKPEAPKEEIENELSEEEKQEKFEQECKAEAAKLKVGLADLKEDIDAFGGAEEFKKHFETPTGGTYGKGGEDEYTVTENLAGKENRKLSAEIKDQKHIAKLFGSFSVTLLAATAIINMMDGPQSVNVDYNAIQALAQSFKTGSATFGDYAQGVAILFTSITTLASAKLSISSFFEARKLKRQQKIDNLKYKMTGVEVKQEK